MSASESNTSESRSEIVMRLAEEFLDRYRQGQRPALKEYIARHPELAAEIKEVFPAMAMMENIALADESLEGEPTSTTSRPFDASLKQLGDYRIIREIGHGGMGVVYEAEQVSLGRHVALKVLPHKALLDAKQKRRFEREAKAAAKLHHTNIVPVFGVGQHDGLPYYVMQFIQGLGLDVVLDELQHMRPGAAHTPSGEEIRISRRDIAAADVARSLMTGAFHKSPEDGPALEASPQLTVATTLERPIDALGPDSSPSQARPDTGRFSDSFTVSSSSIVLPGAGGPGHKTSPRKQTYWHSVANIGRQVADALEYAHKQGILHRDIKPSNLLLDLRGTVWVTDFGLAKIAGPGAEGENLTHTGDILGTLRYMPPEAFEGRSDVRGDVYSLGLTLYEMLTLRPAFGEKDRHKLIKQVTTSEPIALDRVRREIPRDLVTVIHKAIDRDATHRYASAGEFAADLQRFLDDEPVLARRQTQLERYLRWARRNPWIAVLGGVLTGVLVLVTVASLVVAGRMADLALNEARSATDERAARTQAVAAQDREAKERAQAEQAKKAAEESKRHAEQALKKAEVNYAKARAAVNDYLTAVSEDDRLQAPGLQGLRIQLLQSALPFYQEFLKERGTDPALRKELANVYYKVSEIYRELGQAKAARQSLTQARRLYETLAAENPNDPATQHGLAMSYFRSGSRAQAIALLEKLVRPDDARFHADLGSAYNTAALQDGKNDKAKELVFLRKALAVQERLVQLRPDDPEARIGLSASLNNIAVRIRPERDAQAIELLRRAAQECEVAYRLRPSHPLAARFLAIQLNNVANKARRLGLMEEVVATHRRRAEVFDRRARDNPTIPGYESDMVQAYTVYLNVLREAGRLDEAAQLSARARDRIAEANEDTTQFFGQASAFHFAALSVSLARAKGSPEGAAALEHAASEAVLGLRRHVLSGWHDHSWMRTNALTQPLRERGDFKELLAWTDELSTADATAKSTTATAEEKAAARQKTLAALEAVAGPLPSARFVRRNLAQARQELAQALLQTGRVEDARLAFDEALGVRQQLVQEAPSNEQVRADLAQSQSAAGDLFAAAGKLSDAAKTWDKALATLEVGMRANPNSIPFQTALSEQLLHVADQYGKAGLWDLAATHYRRAFEVQPPTEFLSWYSFAMALSEGRDTSESRSLTDRVAARIATAKGVEVLHLSRVILLCPDAAARYPDAVKQLAKGAYYPVGDWLIWTQGLAAVQLGQAERALPLLQQVQDPIQRLPALALALHQSGRVDAARDALRQADQIAEERLRDGLAADSLQIPEALWADWLLLRGIRREAHRTIHGKAMPDSALEHLFRGRVLVALDQPQKAEAEFAAAVAIRPDDVDVWLIRSRIFAKLGQKDRMAADLLHARQLKDDPRPWIETGRLLAEQGESQQADQAFARASALGQGELNRFLDAGWIVGPYPEQLELACPPESEPDPSKPLPAMGGKGELRWKPVATLKQRGKIEIASLMAGSKKVSFYCLAFVYADRERTAQLVLRAGEDARLWFNGRLAFEGFAAWKVEPKGGVRIPVSLKAGRNTLLVKTHHGDPLKAWCECRFLDNPNARDQTAERNKAEDAYARLVLLFPQDPRLWIDRGRRLGELGRWDEAAQAFAKGSVLSPKSPQVWIARGRAHAVLGKWDEAAADFAQALDLDAASATNPTSYSWWNQTHGIVDAVMRHAELYDRLSQLRPKNISLVARKVNDLIAQGHWQQAAACQARVVSLVPKNVAARQVLALLRLAAEDHDGYRLLCRELLPRFQKASDPGIEPMAVLSLLIPDVVVERATIEQWSRAMSKDLKIDQLAYVLAEYRLGNHARVIERAGLFSKAATFHLASLRAVQAASLAKLARYSEAADALRNAREELERLPRPGRVEAPAQSFWWENIRAGILIREAEKLLPPAPAQVAQVGLSSEEQAARKERKARAEKLSTQVALALVRFDSVEAQAAAVELRAVAAARAQLAAEEPANPDYQAQLADTLLVLGQLLVETGRLEGGKKGIQQALAIREKLQGAYPKAVQYQREFGRALLTLGDTSWKMNQPAEAVKSWTQGIEALHTAFQDDPKNKALADQLAAAEFTLGERYAHYSLWDEAGEWMARAARRRNDPTGSYRWLRAAQALQAAGKLEEVHRLVAEAEKRFGASTDPDQAWHRIELAVLLPSRVPLSAKLVSLAEKTAREAPNLTWMPLIIGVCEFRAGRFEEAIRILDTPEGRNTDWGRSFLAMAHHKLGHVDQAKQWLAKAGVEFSEGVRNRTINFAPDGVDGWVHIVNELVYYREAYELINGQPLPLDPLERLYRAGGYLKLGMREKAEAEFKAAVSIQSDNGTIWLARSRIHAGLGNKSEADAHLAKAKELAERALVQRPADENAAIVLAEILKDHHPSVQWQVLTPTRVKSEAGTTLTLLPDRSVLAGGKNPDRDVYTMETKVNGPIAAFRLEALPHPSLPKSGPGRGEGNFILSDFRVTRGGNVVQWSHASADFSQANDSQKSNHPVAFAIDADPSTGWAIWPRFAEPHWAAFFPVQKIEAGSNTSVTIRLAFQNKDWKKHTLGRFRLSVKEQSGVFQSEDSYPPHARLGAIYLFQNDPRRAADLLAKATAANPTLPAADWLVLALAHKRLGEMEKAKAAGHKAAELLKPAGADPALRPLLREAVLAFGIGSSEAIELIAAAAGEPPAALNDAVTQNPGNAKGHRDRGNWYAGRGLWKKAADDFAEAFRLEPSAYEAMQLGILLVQLEDLVGYREHCRAMLARWGSTENNTEADLTAKTCLIHRDSMTDGKQLVRLAEVVVSGDEKQPWFEWFLFAKGLHAYRTGKHAEALAGCRESRRRAPETKANPQALTALNLVVEAMALQRSGDEGGAQRTLTEAKALLDLHVPGIDSDRWWHDWLAANLLYREAVALLAVPPGK